MFGIKMPLSHSPELNQRRTIFWQVKHHSNEIMKLLFAMILPFLTFGQIDCSPFHPVKNYEVNKDVIYSIAYVSCWHARGIMVEMGTDNFQMGTIAMGKRHNNSTYIYFVATQRYRNLRLYAGPLYRINNDPTLGIGRCGVDVGVYKNLFGTLSVSQISTSLNYANFGVKLIF